MRKGDQALRRIKVRVAHLAIVHSSLQAIEDKTMGSLNVGNVDRMLRVLLGLALLGLTLAGTIGWWGYIGVIPLVTGLSARCPVYSVLGITTTQR